MFPCGRRAVFVPSDGRVQGRPALWLLLRCVFVFRFPGFMELRSGEPPCVSVRLPRCLRAVRRESARPPGPLVAASVCFCLPLPPGFTELRSGEFLCVSVLSSCRPAGESKATRPLSPLTDRSRPLRPSGDRRRAALPGGAAALRGVLPLRPLRSLASTRTRAKGPWRPYPLLPRWRGIPERVRRGSSPLGGMAFLQRPAAEASRKEGRDRWPS